MPHTEEKKPALAQTGLQILLWLLRHPFQRAEDLTVALAAHPATIYRHLEHLTSARMVERVRSPLAIRDTSHLYYLTAKGITTCARTLNADPTQLALFWGIHEQRLLNLLPRLHSLITLSTTINGLVQEAPARFSYPGGVRATLTWNWTLDYKHSFLYRQRLSRLAADAILIFHRPPLAPTDHADTYYGMWLFLDTGLCGEYDEEHIRRRLEGLFRYRECAERSFVYNQFPPVLILVTSPRQEAVWQRCAQEIALKSHSGKILQGATATLPPAGRSVASPWHLPWHDLGSNAACHLLPLLPPMAQQAVPPGVLTRSQPLQGAKTLRAGHKSLPVGKYSKRALSVSKTARSDNEAERVAVSLLGLHFSRRHMELLHTLYVYPWLKTSEIAAFSDIEPGSATRYLYELRQYSCAQKEATECGSRWCLTNRGLRLIASHLHLPLRHITARDPGLFRSSPKVIQRGASVLRAQLHHTTAIYDFFARLHRVARAQRNGAHRLAWFELGARCERHYKDEGQWHTLRPDGAFEYRWGAEHLLGWLEWDEGNMNPSQLQTKVEAYARYVRTREWAKNGSATLPFLYVVVPNRGQLQRFAEIARTHLPQARLTVRITTASRLRDMGPLASIWFEIVPGQDTTTDSRKFFLDR